MKIRTGFVSNSSSSSFVVAFSKKPKCTDDVQKEMFGDEKNHVYPYGLNDDTRSYTTIKIANVVFKDIKKPASKTKIIKVIAEGWYEGGLEWPSFDFKFGSPEWKVAWKKHEKENKTGAKKIAENFIEKNKGKKIYTFSYGDQDGPFYGMMEHTEIFRRLPYIRISYH